MKVTTVNYWKMPQMKDKEIISYAHMNAPNGVRFYQYQKDKLPHWAVDVVIKKAFKQAALDVRQQVTIQALCK